MPDAKMTKKKSTPAVEEKKAPHELFWEAGQSLYQALQKSDEQARNKFALTYQEQQQHLWKVQLKAQKRADELRHEYWSTLNQATGEDCKRVYQEATQKYHDALWEIQTNILKEWEAAGASHQKSLTNLQETFQMSRLTAFNAYKHACQKVWSELDPNTLSCEGLASIGQSLLMGAHFVGGKPHRS